MNTYVFQLTEEQVERSSTLEVSDVGKWCFVLKGCIQGFKDTAEEAEQLLKYVQEDK